DAGRYRRPERGTRAVKRLYHYTSIERWELIEAAGHLRRTESNMSATKEHAGPDVVWLTTDPECAYDHGVAKTQDGTDKTRVRITVELLNRDVHKWREWVTRRGIAEDWLRGLASVGGSGTWRVTEKPIPSTRWVEVVDRADGTALWSASTAPSLLPDGR
uniref:hypothetical protein n=1 Tax=Mycobacterium sp. TaxID=1785 RepID=UPI003F989500